jgi:hypothetical protein
MSDWPQIPRSLFYVTTSEKDGATANYALLDGVRFAALPPAETAIFAYLSDFYRQYRVAPAWDTVQKWAETQLNHELTAVLSAAEQTNAVYGADFTEAIKREVAACDASELLILFRGAMEIAQGTPTHPATSQSSSAARQHVLDGLAQILKNNASNLLPLVSFADLTEKPLTWFWPLRIPAGMLSFIVGDPDQGKSALTVDLAARKSTGTAFPDGAPCPQGKVIIMSEEDDYERTIKPRLRVAGADQTNVSTIPLENQDFCLETDLPRLEATLKANPAISLIILDPLLVFIGGTDTHNEKEVRKILSALWRVCAETGVTIIGILHFRKATGSAIDRVAGSRGFSAAPRSIWGCGPHPEDDDPHRHIFVKIKGNLGRPVEGLVYRTVGIGSTPETEIVKVEWETGAANFRPNDVFGGGTIPSIPDNSPRAEIEQWLRGILSAGPLPAKTVGDLADGARYRWKTVLRASVDLGVRKEKKGFQGASLWSLPAPKQDSKGSEDTLQKTQESKEDSKEKMSSLSSLDSLIESPSPVEANNNNSACNRGEAPKKTGTPSTELLSSLDSLSSLTEIKSIKEDSEDKEDSNAERLVVSSLGELASTSEIIVAVPQVDAVPAVHSVPVVPEKQGATVFSIGGNPAPSADGLEIIEPPPTNPMPHKKAKDIELGDSLDLPDDTLDLDGEAPAQSGPPVSTPTPSVLIPPPAPVVPPLPPGDLGDLMELD